MKSEAGNTSGPASYIRFGATALIAFAWICACTPPFGPPAEPPPPPSDPLIAHTPYVGDETEFREVPPEPFGMTLGDKWVEGWKVPTEEMLRFPIELREGGRFTFQLGAQTRVPVRIGDLTMRVEYLPYEMPQGAGEGQEPREVPEEYEPFVLFQTTPIDTPTCFMEWYHVDTSLNPFAPGRGEIRFVTDGPLSGDPGLDIVFGQPVIYYPEEKRNRNVLLIGVDTLRRDCLAPYGAPEDWTPYLQEFSESATIFTQARSQAPWTLPSFASMLTGGLPSEIGATIYTGHLPERNTTIAEVLQPLGYATGTICSNMWIGNEESGFYQGMEELWFQNNASAEESVARAKDFIERSNGRDWFCFLHFIDPHAPYTPPEEYASRMCDPAYDGPYKDGFGQVELWKSGEVVPETEDLEHVWDLYTAEVVYLDYELGRLFAWMEQEGLLENTLIIFAADHGEEFFEHDGFEHGHTQYDELVHMPLMVRGPGFPEGERIDTNVGNTDIMPTILRHLDLEMTEGLVGMPLQDVVAGLADESRMTFGEDNSRGTLRKFGVQYPYKCILDYVTGDARLYDLEADPGENVDVSGDHRELTREISQKIVSAMLPDQTAFHIWITRSYGETSKRFEGQLRIPGGIEYVLAFKLSTIDNYAVQGDTVRFALTSSHEIMGPNKHIMVVPAEGADTLEISITVDGRIQPDRLFPYGSKVSEPSCSATVSIDDFALGPDLPLAIEELSAGCYVWGVRGYDRDENRILIDEQTREELRALGYIAW